MDALRLEHAWCIRGTARRPVGLEMDCVRGKVAGDNVMVEPCRLLHRHIGFLSE